MRDVLPVFQDIFGYVDWNHLCVINNEVTEEDTICHQKLWSKDLLVRRACKHTDKWILDVGKFENNQIYRIFTDVLGNIQQFFWFDNFIEDPLCFYRHSYLYKHLSIFFTFGKRLLFITMGLFPLSITLCKHLDWETSRHVSRKRRRW